jgi:hypothetical protein
MSNTGRIPLWLIGLVGGLAVITMLSLFIYVTEQVEFGAFQKLGDKSTKKQGAV